MPPLNFGPRNHIALAYLPSQGKVVSGSITGGRQGNVGRLRLWDVRPGAELTMDAKEATFPAENGSSFFPRGMTLLTMRPGGNPDHAEERLPATAGVSYP